MFPSLTAAERGVNAVAQDGLNNHVVLEGSEEETTSLEFAGKKLLILDLEGLKPPDVYSPTEDWAIHLRRLRIPFESVSVRGSLDRLRLVGATHLLLAGSTSSVADEQSIPLWFFDVENLVQEAIGKGLPILGGCFGAQLLARVLAGPGAVMRMRELRVGWESIHVKMDDPLLGAAGFFFSAFVAHDDEIYSLPASAETLACSKRTAIHAFRIPGKNIWGIQAHPEVTKYLAYRFLRRVVEETKGRERELFEAALKSQPQDSGHIDHILTAFMQQS
ncbi:MAG: hypothetical protein A3D22_06660 [Deltaproteobacteria bacterium RIFCSPHIGHO2_02_FULL_44_53]|nr:MAG: hypothetical protein A3D22_06660 [Deltaproteobacteria bacterium RIFCSPHIGHO2_02_FULL_44_53]